MIQKGDSMPKTNSLKVQKAADYIRYLSLMSIEKARSGHPGLPLGCADLGVVLYRYFLCHCPKNPDWPNRDRFILSAGHGSMLLYSLLNVSGFDISLEDLNHFRQWKSRTPGHPELHIPLGMETTTGPLGQGFANAVGVAIAAKWRAQRYNRPGFSLFNYRVYALVGDGCLMEGVSYEAASLAGHLALDNLVVIYDSNHISIDGNTDITFTEDVASRFQAQGWAVAKADGLNPEAFASEMEALLLESELVKIHNPYFNTQLKDDKSYPYIKVTTEHLFPGIYVLRKNRKMKKGISSFYGPFTDVEITRKAVKKLRKIFQIRNCRERKFEAGKPCLDFQIGLCSAPCAGEINQDDYQKKVRECSLLLAGKQNVLLRNLKQEMKISSQLMLYEKAAKIRDTIRMIENIISQEKISRSYQRKLNEYLEEKINDFSPEKALLDLKNYLGLPVIPLTIEAFDISNIHGQLAVGSMVVFQSGIPDKKKYRHFKIKEVKGINDFAMMREVIFRRFRESYLKTEQLPDLILLDGGKGQLNIVQRTLNELNLRMNMVAIAKREEELFQPEKRESILLPRNSEVFFLIQRIRDEAHRFAINYHKRLRRKLLRSSVIDFIPGIGEKRKRQLLSKFKNIEEIRKVDIEKLKKIAGIGEKTARKIKDILEARYDFEI